MRKSQKYYIKQIQETTDLEKLVDILNEAYMTYAHFSGAKIVKAYIAQFVKAQKLTPIDVDVSLLNHYITYSLRLYGNIFKYLNFVHVSHETAKKKWLTASNGYDMLRVPTELQSGIYCIHDGKLYRYSKETLEFTYPIPMQYTLVGTVNDLSDDGDYYHTPTNKIRKGVVCTETWYVFVHRKPTAPIVISETIGIGEGQYIITMPA